MSERIDHAAEARANLATVADVVQDSARVSVADMVAIAQVQATLALVEQERIANVIALGQFRIAPGDVAHFRGIVAQPKDEFTLQVSPQIAEALGLS